MRPGLAPALDRMRATQTIKICLNHSDYSGKDPLRRIQDLAVHRRKKLLHHLHVVSIRRLGSYLTHKETECISLQNGHGSEERLLHEGGLIRRG